MHSRDALDFSTQVFKFPRSASQPVCDCLNYKGETSQTSLIQNIISALRVVCLVYERPHCVPVST
jgi:hypothetical protein